jgi:hypothetical protein
MNKQHCQRALKLMLEHNQIDFDRAPYWQWLDNETRLYVLPDRVEFMTANQTVQITVKQLETA